MDHRIQTLIVSSCLTLLVACGSSGSDPGTGGSDHPDGGTSTSDGGPDELERTGTPANFTFLTAKVVGRRGLDLRLDMEAEDPESDVSSVALRAYGADGKPVNLRDSDLDGEADSPDITVPFAAKFTGTTLNDMLVVAGLLAKSGPIMSVDVTLLDRGNNPSNELHASVTQQPVRELGEACDVTWMLDRCKKGLACRGEPAACVEGVPPTISRVAYLRDSSGPKILVLGTDIDEDVSALRVDFLDTKGNAVQVDLDGDDIDESSSFVLTSPDASQGKDFFISLEAGESFDELVPQVSVRVEDEGERLSDAKSTLIASTPTRGRGSSCDPRGFDRCIAGLVCSPGVPGISNTCQDTSRLQKLACQAAPVLDPATGAKEVFGETGTASLWDAPSGCGPRDPADRPDSAIMLHLEAGAHTILLSTDYPETNFDTMIYVTQGCATATTPAMACADDLQNSVASKLELKDLPSGDYLIVIDAWGPTGGSFRLSAKVE